MAGENASSRLMNSCGMNETGVKLIASWRSNEMNCVMLHMNEIAKNKITLQKNKEKVEKNPGV